MCILDLFKAGVPRRGKLLCLHTPWAFDRLGPGANRSSPKGAVIVHPSGPAKMRLRVEAQAT